MSPAVSFKLSARVWARSVGRQLFKSRLSYTLTRSCTLTNRSFGHVCKKRAPTADVDRGPCRQIDRSTARCAGCAAGHVSQFFAIGGSSDDGSSGPWLRFRISSRSPVSVRRVGSLRRQIRRKDRLFVNSSSQEVIEFLKEREIEPFAFDPSKSLMPSIFLARFFTYYEYLRDQWANGNVFNQILLTDVRDVIFQKRLFGTACDTLEFHLEEAFPTIQECPNNSK